MADHFRKGDRVRHLVTKEVGTVLRAFQGFGWVRVQFDDDFCEGVGWPWLTEPEKLEQVITSYARRPASP